MEEHTVLAILQVLITALATVAASSGFWIYMDRKKANRDAMNRLLIGLAHDRIIFLSMKYIERKFITQDEHENLYEFLYKPYKDLGGNGSADRLMEEVNRLPIFNKNTHMDQRLKGEKDDSEQQGL